MQAVQMDHGSGVGGVPPPHQQMPDDVGLAAAADPQFVALRNTNREKILENIGRTQLSAHSRRKLPELARRLEEILFRKFPSKSDYYNMMRGPFAPHLQYAVKFFTAQNEFLSAQNAQRQRNLEMQRQIASIRGYVMIPTPGITQCASGNAGVSYVPHHMGPSSSSGAGTVTQNDNTGEVPIEPKFSCPVCMNELVNASSTTCGHIFCQYCIGASILAQSKCPTCRRTLTLRDFHRVYLPTMD